VNLQVNIVFCNVVSFVESVILMIQVTQLTVLSGCCGGEKMLMLEPTKDILTVLYLPIGM